MKKLFYIICLILLSTSLVYGADSKISALTEDTDVAGTDITVTVEDPGGSPASKKATWANAVKGALGILKGTLTDGKYCTYTSSGTLFDCNSTPVTGSGTNHYWSYFTGTNVIAGKSITASKPVCSDANGDPGVCAGTEGVWQVAGSYLTSVSPTNMASSDFGSFTCNGTTCTIDALAVASSMLADADFGSFTCSSGTCTIDNSVVTVGKLASADFGDFTCNGSACTLDESATSVSDAAYSIDWNDDTTVAPSKNAVYDKIVDVIAGYPTASSLHVDDILTALGIASEATHFGSFTGSTLTDNQTAKALFQEIEDSLEDKVDAGSTASYSQPTGNALIKKTGDGTIGTSYIVPAGPTTDRTITFDDADQTVAARNRDNTFTGANTIGDAGDDQIIKLNVNANDGTFSGFTLTRTVDSGATASFGQAMYVASDGELASADADAASTGPAICILVTAGTGASKQCLTHGTVSETDWNWTVGGIIYLGTDPATTTGLTQTAPSGTGDVVQVLGVALSADTIMFNPSLVQVVLE